MRNHKNPRSDYGKTKETLFNFEGSTKSKSSKGERGHLRRWPKMVAKKDQSYKQHYSRYKDMGV